jgi:hypothetical protein
MDEGHERLQGLIDQQERTDRMAAFVLRWPTRRLWLIAIATILCGAGLSLYLRDANWLSRSGDVATALSIIHALVAMRHDWIFGLVLRQPEANSIEQLNTAMQRRFAMHHLLVAALGTLIAAFGNLLPVAG